MSTLNELIRHDIPLKTDASAVYPFKPNLERKYRFMSRFGEEVLLHRVEGDTIRLPRALCPVGKVDDRSEGEAVDYPDCPTMRPDQVSWFEATLKFLKNGLSGVTVAGTGRGKTVCGFYVTHHLRRKTLVITTKDDIYKQWLEGAQKFLGLKPHEIGEIRGDKCEVIGTKFVVAMIHSLSKEGKYPDWITKDFGLVIFDECFHPDHELLTPSGWKPVSEVTDQDKVMAFNAETGSVQFEPVLRTVAKPFVGNLVRVKGNKFHTLTTPGHEQPIRRKRDSGWELGRSTLGDLNLHSRVQLPVSGRLAGTGELTALEKLRIAFEADGHLLYTSKKAGEHTYRFAFRRERKIGRLSDILRELGWAFTVRENCRGDTNIVFKSDVLLTKDFSWFDPFEDGGRNESFLSELTEWDGWTDSSAGFWEHKSRAVADFVQLIAQLAGRNASIVPVGTKWRVRWCARQVWVDSGGFRKEEVPYSGMVYCVTVPSGNVVTRLNGTISISGNCHRVPAEQFSAVVDMFPAKLRLGLSATPERADGKELLVLAHIGPVRVKAEAQLMVPKVLVFRSSWECPRVFRSDPVTGQKRVVRLPHQAGKTAHLEKILAADPVRNHLIAELIYFALNKNRQIVVFSTLHDHLRSLHRACHEAFGISGRQMGFYIGASTKAEKEAREREKAKPVLFTTYSMMGEGTDIPWLDTCILAMPRSNVVQPVGRIRREYPDKAQPIVMDIQDQDSPVFSAYAANRLKWYASIGAVVKLMDQED